MADQQLRQSELFAGQNWQSIYKAFSQISFQSYDFDTIRRSLIEYIQRSYPEDFTDWIDNQEFIFLIDLISYLGQSLAFRTDLNSRENFLDTAERRDSILRLARMLGYSPRRNYPARGLLKLSKVKTSEDVRDSNGDSLANIEINWNDVTNQDWFEQFVLILNAALIPSNPFGLPVKDGIIGGIKTQLYSMNNVSLRTVVEGFTKPINGQGMNFEVINPDFDSLGFFYERQPDPLGSKHLIYRNDGAGNSSPNSGFFAYFKQGELNFKTYNFEFPQENRTIDIDIDNINELDVWVQEINDSGFVVKQWTKVPTVENIAYNSVDRQVREIFSVSSKDNDQITIRFGDGRFGKSPTGLFRVWYRVSNGQQYQIQSQEMQNVQVIIPYIKTNTGGRAQEYNLTLTFNLEYGISSRDAGGSLPRETEDQIKKRAPQVYYTQNRMVNGEDYNVFPLQMGNSVKRVKAINRIYSGQSRYIDINDPTGRYQNTIVFADDGIIYRELFNRSDFESLPTVKTAREIIDSRIQPLLQELDLNDFFYTNFPRIQINENPHKVRWFKATSITGSSSGEFRADLLDNDVYVPQAIGPGVSGNYAYLKEGALVKFVDSDTFTKEKWAKIEQVVGNGTDPAISTAAQGPVVLNEDIFADYRVLEVIPAFRTSLVESEISAIEDQISGNFTFALRYDTLSSLWTVITTNNISLSAFSLINAGDQSNTNADSSWLLLAEYLPGAGYWKFTTRNLRYVFESVDTNRFYFAEDTNIVDVQRNLALRDIINILEFNSGPEPITAQLESNYQWELVRPFVYADGFIEPRRVQISFLDSDRDGVPDNPDYFDFIVDPEAEISGSSMTSRYVYHKLVIVDEYEYLIPDDSIITLSVPGDISLSTLLQGEVGYVISTGIFYERQSDDSLLDVSEFYKAYIGRAGLNYSWKHYAPRDNRIDPAITNIIDMYVLTEAYYQQVLLWLNSINKGAFPVPPTTDDLRILFNALEKFKMVSDEIIWHPAKYKVLFGDGAIEELKAQFKVIKVPGTTVTDNEIKQRIISAINEFFDVANWNFGETFYASELSTYVHQQLATIVASFVIVPQKETSKFGNLFVVRSEPDEIFLSTATVNDISIVSNYTTNNIKIGY